MSIQSRHFATISRCAPIRRVRAGRRYKCLNIPSYIGLLSGKSSSNINAKPVPEGVWPTPDTGLIDRALPSIRSRYYWPTHEIIFCKDSMLLFLLRSLRPLLVIVQLVYVRVMITNLYEEHFFCFSGSLLETYSKIFCASFCPGFFNFYLYLPYLYCIQLESWWSWT
jgi:hypothetical protein